MSELFRTNFSDMQSFVTFHGPLLIWIASRSWSVRTADGHWIEFSVSLDEIFPRGHLRGCVFLVSNLDRYIEIVMHVKPDETRLLHFKILQWGWANTQFRHRRGTANVTWVIFQSRAPCERNSQSRFASDCYTRTAIAVLHQWKHIHSHNRGNNLGSKDLFDCAYNLWEDSTIIGQGLKDLSLSEPG